MENLLLLRHLYVKILSEKDAVIDIPKIEDGGFVFSFFVING